MDKVSVLSMYSDARLLTDTSFFQPYVDRFPRNKHGSHFRQTDRNNFPSFIRFSEKAPEDKRKYFLLFSL